MMPSLTRPIALAALLLAGCVRASGPGPGDPGAEAERHRAALATITVENATPRRLRIAFRPAAGPGADVVVGAVGPDSSAILAPVPAGEPLLLSAIAPDSSRFVIAPRSFDPGEHWTWRISPDAAFGAAATRAP